LTKLNIIFYIIKKLTCYTQSTGHLSDGIYIRFPVYEMREALFPFRNKKRPMAIDGTWEALPLGLNQKPYSENLKSKQLAP